MGLTLECKAAIDWATDRTTMELYTDTPSDYLWTFSPLEMYPRDEKMDDTTTPLPIGTPDITYNPPYATSSTNERSANASKYSYIGE